MPWRTVQVRMLSVALMVVLFVAGGWSDGRARSQAAISRADAPVGDAITYQGWLQQNDVAVEGLCDLNFSLFDSAIDGAQIGSTLARANHTVTGGYFTVSDLDFGAVFTGAARWIEVAVRCPAGNGDFTTLIPRQPLTPAPTLDTRALCALCRQQLGISGECRDKQCQFCRYNGRCDTHLESQRYRGLPFAAQ